MLTRAPIAGVPGRPLPSILARRTPCGGGILGCWGGCGLGRLVGGLTLGDGFPIAIDLVLLWVRYAVLCIVQTKITEDARNVGSCAE